MHFSKSPETSREHVSEYIKNIGRKKYQRGAPTIHEGGGRAPFLVGSLVALRCPSSAIWSLSMRKNNNKPTFRTRLRRHEAEPWRNQSRASAELFCQGNFPPGGENHHQRSSHREGVNLHQHLHQHHPISNPSSSLVSNLCIQTCRIMGSGKSLNVRTLECARRFLPYRSTS